MCELLQAADGAPSLQQKLLSTLASTLRSMRSDASLSSHYTREVACAGPHASGRLRYGWASLLEQMVRLLSPSHPSAAPAVPSLTQLWCLKCLLHVELRAEDLPVLQVTHLLSCLLPRLLTYLLTYLLACYRAEHVPMLGMATRSES